jgi:hypothetical protein
VKGSTQGTRRRSQRVIITLAITVRTVERPKELSFIEETQTLVVNAHGALVILAGQVRMGQQLLIANRATQQEQLCRVASLGPTTAGKAQVGLEFLKPSRDFWHISFPPEDWVLPEPASSNAEKS